MVGNVWEWVNDWYDPNYYSSSPGNNPTGPTGGNSKVLRGGGWYYSLDDLRVAGRHYYGLAYRISYLGFRCIATPGN